MTKQGTYLQKSSAGQRDLTTKNLTRAFDNFCEIMGWGNTLPLKENREHFCPLGKFLPAKEAEGAIVVDIVTKYTQRLDILIFDVFVDDKQRRKDLINIRIPYLEEFCAFLREVKDNLYVNDKPLSFEEWCDENWRFPDPLEWEEVKPLDFSESYNPPLKTDSLEGFFEPSKPIKPLPIPKPSKTSIDGFTSPKPYVEKKISQDLKNIWWEQIRKDYPYSDSSSKYTTSPIAPNRANYMDSEGKVNQRAYQNALDDYRREKHNIDQNKNYNRNLSQQNKEIDKIRQQKFNERVRNYQRQNKEAYNKNVYNYRQLEREKKEEYDRQLYEHRQLEKHRSYEAKLFEHERKLQRKKIEYEHKKKLEKASHEYKQDEFVKKEQTYNRSQEIQELKHKYKQRLDESLEQARIHYNRYHRTFDEQSIDPRIKKKWIYGFLKKYTRSVDDVLLRYKPTVESYVDFIYSIQGYFSWLSLLFRPQTFCIAESEREEHTYLTGSSGSGKSELIKVMIHNYLKTLHKSVVLIDPHGDLCKQLAFHKDFIESDRVIYLDFGNSSYLPSFNPLQLPDKRSETINFYIQHLVKAIQEISGDLSDQMGTLVANCLSVLFLEDSPTLRDLQLFMYDEKNAPYMEAGKRHPNSAIRDFFNALFVSRDAFQRTRNAIAIRLQSLFANDRFLQITTKSNSFDLEKAVNSGKIVLCNLSNSKLGEDVSQAIGKLIIAQLSGIAYRRESIAEKERPHTHLFIDECQKFISGFMSKAFQELRKYKLMMTVANQYVNQFPANVADSVLTNTSVKILGRSYDTTIRVMQDEMGLSDRGLGNMKKGDFYVKTKSQNYPAKVKIIKNFLGDRDKADKKKIRDFMKKQYEKYYLKLSGDLAGVEPYPDKTTTPKKILEQEEQNTTGFQSKYSL